MRIARLMPRQPHQRQHLVHTGTALGWRQVFNAKGHVATNVQVRKQRIVLKHHAHLAVLRWQ